MTTRSTNIDALLLEERTYPPMPELAREANDDRATVEAAKAPPLLRTRPSRHGQAVP